MGFAFEPSKFICRGCGGTVRGGETSPAVFEHRDPTCNDPCGVLNSARTRAAAKTLTLLRADARQQAAKGAAR